MSAAQDATILAAVEGCTRAFAHLNLCCGKDAVGDASSGHQGTWQGLLEGQTCCTWCCTVSRGIYAEGGIVLISRACDGWRNQAQYVPLDMIWESWDELRQIRHECAHARCYEHQSRPTRRAAHATSPTIESFTICVQLDREQGRDGLSSQQCNLSTELNVNRAHHPAL